MISQSAPGKLYIAGEYAVVEPGHQAVLVAVDRFITVRITQAEDGGSAGPTGHISSTLYEAQSLTWYRRPEDGVVMVDKQFDDYVVSAIRMVEQMVREAGGPLRYFDLDVSSELDDGCGRKLGLGSSSAVTVATVRAVARFYGLVLDDMAVYKLALLATDAVQPIGSGGDIAASSFTGWVAYTSPDRAWLHQVSGAPGTGNSPGGSAGLSELVRMDWPLLSIRRLPAPGLRLSVGWTGSPASTPRLVADVQAHARGAQDAAYTAFLRESEACLSALTLALREDDGGEIGLRIQEGRRLLSGLSRTSGITIETPQLRRLVEIAQEHGAVAKSSGAGGGDCGIALCPPGTDMAAMHAAWESAGIQPLDLRVHSHSGDDS